MCLHGNVQYCNVCDILLCTSLMYVLYTFIYRTCEHAHTCIDMVVYSIVLHVNYYNVCH